MLNARAAPRPAPLRVGGRALAVAPRALPVRPLPSLDVVDREEPRRGPSARVDSRGAASHTRRREDAGLTPPAELLPNLAEDTLEMPLSKALADAGIASRRATTSLIREGRARINGAVCLWPQTRVVAGRDEVQVDGRRVKLPLPSRRRLYYYAINKPKGYLCSSKAAGPEAHRHASRRVVDLLADVLAEIEQREARKPPSRRVPPPRFFTVGRLDVKTSGLMFVTNDGQWADLMIHPSSGILREYTASLSRVPTDSELGKLRAGYQTPDGGWARPVRVQRIHGRTQGVRVFLREGRNHEVRKLVENVAGLTVKNLRRCALGGYRLPRSVPQGAFTPLTAGEVEALRSLALAGRAKRARQLAKQAAGDPLSTEGSRTGPSPSGLAPRASDKGDKADSVLECTEEGDSSSEYGDEADSASELDDEGDGDSDSACLRD